MATAPTVPTPIIRLIRPDPTLDQEAAAEVGTGVAWIATVQVQHVISHDIQVEICMDVTTPGEEEDVEDEKHEKKKKKKHQSRGDNSKKTMKILTTVPSEVFKSISRQQDTLVQFRIPIPSVPGFKHSWEPTAYTKMMAGRIKNRMATGSVVIQPFVVPFHLEPVSPTLLPSSASHRQHLTPSSLVRSTSTMLANAVADMALNAPEESPVQAETEPKTHHDKEEDEKEVKEVEKEQEQETETEDDKTIHHHHYYYQQQQPQPSSHRNHHHHYSSQQQEVSSEDPQYRTKMCKYWKQGNCHKADACSWAHGHEQLQPYKNHSSYKTSLCRYHESSDDGCRLGDKCKFAHGVEELQTRED